MCVHGNERTRTYDAIHDTFAAIAWNVSFHVRWEQLHAFLSTTFNSSHWRINIVLIKDGIHTLVDIVIIDPTRVDLFPQSCITQGFVSLDAVQVKESSYHNRHPTNHSSF
jgi:hypothetical protein